MMRCIRVKNWRQAQDLSEKMILWGFRGQEDVSWELNTTLNRAAKIYGFPLDWLWHREYWMLRQFQRRAHYYCKDLPPYNQKLDWLALMQHYGAPTRLLDFSHSFYVAAFFALENATTDSAVWAINMDSLRRQVAANCNVSTLHENIDLTNQRHIDFVNDHISEDGKEKEKKTPLVVNVEPKRLHERLLCQQGFFLFPCDISKGFDENLCSTYGYSLSAITSLEELELEDNDVINLNVNKDILIKIVLPKEVKAKALDSLVRMNISAATLFPGLDGFARSMKYHIAKNPFE